MSVEIGLKSDKEEGEGDNSRGTIGASALRTRLLLVWKNWTACLFFWIVLLSSD